MNRAARKEFEKNQRNAMEPTITTRESHGDTSTVESHPAYGQIMAFKTSGQQALYGSDFAHQNYVSIEIHESELYRNLSRDWPFARKELIRIHMSEAQWGSFVSSFGKGEGTQCTIGSKMVGGTYQNMPSLKLRDAAPLYKAEGRKNIDDALKQIDELIASVETDTTGLSKAKATAVLTKLHNARRKLGPSLNFVADSFEEHLEERTEKAKTEVMAWMNNTIMRAGLDSLGIAPLTQIEAPDNHEDSTDEMEK